MKQLTNLETFEETLTLYRRYIQTVATRFNRDEIKEDLISEGQIGLYQAFVSYNEDKGPFHAYAQYYVKGSMLKFIDKHGETIRTSFYTINQNEGDITTTISTSTEIGEDMTIEDLLADVVEDNSLDDSNKAKLDHLRAVLSKLKPKAVQVILMRITQDMTFKEIAEEMNDETNNIRQMFHKNMDKLKINLKFK